jgi:hypothetical protein
LALGAWCLVLGAWRDQFENQKMKNIFKLAALQLRVGSNKA